MTAGRGPNFSASRPGRERHPPRRGDDGSRDSESHVQCRLCRRWLRAISYTHLRYKHGILVPQSYKEEFAVEKITSKEVRRRIAEQKVLVDRHATDYIRRHWGKTSLKEITRYLGVDASTVRAHAMRLGLGLLVEQWTDAKVLRLLKDSWKRGLPLSSGQARHRLAGLYKAAIRRFGSWKTGLERAGIPYREVSRRGPLERWTPGRILEEIRSLLKKGREEDYLYLRSNHSKLYAAARNHFGNWGRAVRVARSTRLS